MISARPTVPGLGDDTRPTEPDFTEPECVEVDLDDEAGEEVLASGRRPRRCETVLPPPPAPGVPALGRRAS